MESSAMPDVRVPVGMVELRVLTLSKKVLLQMPIVGYDQLKALMDGEGHLAPSAAIGWVHGSVLDRTEEYKRWLIVRLGEAEYGRFAAMPSTCAKFPQLYVV
jgi:hypothetical protein